MAYRRRSTARRRATSSYRTNRVRYRSRTPVRRRRASSSRSAGRTIRLVIEQASAAPAVPLGMKPAPAMTKAKF